MRTSVWLAPALALGLAAFIPAIVITWGSFIAYTLILNGLGGKMMGRIWFPTPPWWPLILWVTPAISVAGVMAAVLISSRVNTFMAAYQASKNAAATEEQARRSSEEKARKDQEAEDPWSTLPSGTVHQDISFESFKPPRVTRTLKSRS